MSKKNNIIENLFSSRSTIKTNLIYMIIFGILAAVFANIKFSIPGLESGTSDAREILALISTAFLTHWIFAVGVGLIASFGAYHNLSVNILMHITAIPIAWFILNYIKNKISNITLISLLWGFGVLFLSLFIYPGVYTVSNYFLGNIESANLINNYFLFIKGTTFEAIINIVITSMAIFSIFIFREVEKKSTYLSLIENNTELGLWDWDLNENQRIYNNQWAKILGYTLEEVYEREDLWKELIHKDDYKDTLKKLDDNLQRKTEFYNAEYRMRSRSGKYIWIHDKGKVLSRDSNGKAMRMVGIHLDITKQKQLSDKILNLQNYLSNTINSMPSIIIGVSTDLKITQWNKKIEELTGILEKKAKGKFLIDVLPQMQNEIENIKKSIHSKQLIEDNNISNLLVDKFQYSDFTVYPLINNGVEGAVIRIDDVTERVRLEEMMIQSEKMLSVGGLAAGMAHEINNPLAGMLQNAQVIQNRLTQKMKKNEEIAKECGTTFEAIQSFMEKRKIIEMLEAINITGKRASKIVENMLSFSRKSELRFSSHDIRKILDDTIELAASDYDLKKKYDFRKIKIIKEYDKDVPLVTCERSNIQQVFLNILRNGAQEMMEIENKKEDPCFILRVNQKDDMVKIEIEDNGPGMNEESRRRAFEPFFTTKKASIGSGLGLSVSYFIVTEQHNGKMSIESIKDKGAKIIISLKL